MVPTADYQVGSPSYVTYADLTKNGDVGQVQPARRTARSTQEIRHRLYVYGGKG